MAVYIINIVLIFFWATVLLNREPKNKMKKIYCGIIAFQWILISGLRSWSVGADTTAYYAAFEEVKRLSWKRAFDNCWDYLFNGLEIKDPGYNLLQKIFQIFFKDYQIFLIAIAIFFTCLMARWIYKYSKMPEISFFIYSVLFYAFFAITGHRQTIATALVCFWGYELIEKKKYFKYLIVAFIAFMIHKSSAVFVIYMIIANISFTPIYVLIMVITMILFAMFGPSIYGPVAISLGFTQEQVDYAVGGAETYATVLLFVCLIAFILYPGIKSRREDSKHLYNMMFLTTASTILVYYNQGFMRIQQYFSMMIMVMIPEIILSGEKKSQKLVYIAVVVILFVYLIAQNPQYSFFWQK